MTCFRNVVAAVGVSMLALPAAALPRAAATDTCSDQFLLALADRSQIAALSPKSHVPESFYRDRAKGLPTVAPSSEAVLALAPDLVVTSWVADPRFGQRMKDFHIPVVTVKPGNDLATMIENVRMIGAALGQEKRATAMAADLEARISEMGAPAPDAPRALYLTPSGFTAGSGTFVDAILKLAGFRNAAAEHGVTGWQSVPLEGLVMRPPAVFVTGFFDEMGDAASNWSIGRSAALKTLFARTPTIHLDGRYWSCNGLFGVMAAEEIRKRWRLGQIRHPGEGRDPAHAGEPRGAFREGNWIPASAGMTKKQSGLAEKVREARDAR